MQIKLNRHPNAIKVVGTQMAALLFLSWIIAYIWIDSIITVVLFQLGTFTCAHVYFGYWSRNWVNEEFIVTLGKSEWRQGSLQRVYGVGTLVFENQRITGIALKDYICLGQTNA